MSFWLQFLVIRNSNKKFNPIKIFISSFSIRWCHFYSVEVDGDVALVPLKFGQLEFYEAQTIFDVFFFGNSVRKLLQSFEYFDFIWR
ncbi:hypothetical protein AHAS_Ahas19G0189300 [Arachis hypogaea]